MKRSVHLEVTAETLANANVQAQELAAIADLSKIDPKFSYKKRDKDDMDAGSIIALVLGAPSIIILARGIAKYLAVRPNVQITLRHGKKEITVKGASNWTARSIAGKFQKMLIPPSKKVARPKSKKNIRAKTDKK